jgi:hypothetical protein
MLRLPLSRAFYKVRKFARRPNGSSSPPCPHCGSDSTWEKEIKRPRLHKCLDCYEEFGDEEAHVVLDSSRLPGQELSTGDIFEPETQPDLQSYVTHKVGGGETSNSLNFGTGFVTTSGEGIQMGPVSQRYEDHRSALPSLSAMIRWGWSPETTRRYEEGTRTAALFELLQRSGLIRSHFDSSGSVLTFGTKPTKVQVQKIQDHLLRSRPNYVVLSTVDGKEVELSGNDIWDLDKHIKKLTRHLPLVKE